MFLLDIDDATFFLCAPERNTAREPIAWACADVAALLEKEHGAERGVGAAFVVRLERLIKGWTKSRERSRRSRR